MSPKSWGHGAESLRLPFDSKSLAVFVKVVEAHSMSEAARQLGLTQSAVSQIVKTLENELGVLLLDRSMRPIQVTSAGNELFNHGSRWLSEMISLSNQITSSHSNKLYLLRVGLVDSFASTAGPSLIKRIAHRAENLTVMSGVSPILWESIKQRKIDLAITMPPQEEIPGVAQTSILQENYLIALPKNSDVTSSDLELLTERLPFIRYSRATPSGSQAESYLKWLRLQPSPGLSFDTADAVLSMVASGLGWTITTPLCLLQANSYLPEIRCVPLSEPAINRQLVLMTRENELGDLPQEINILSKDILRRECFSKIQSKISWLAESEFQC